MIRQYWWGAALILLVLGGCDLEQKHARENLRSENASMRVDALQVLARAGDPADQEEVVLLITDRSPRVRRAAVAALGALGPGKHLHKVVGRLRDADIEVRLAAVRVLGDSSKNVAQRALLPMALDPSLIVRRAAAAALAARGMSPAQQTAALAQERLSEQLALLKQEDDQVRATAALEVGLSGDPRGAAPLQRLLQDDSLLVVRAAAHALGLINSKDAAGALDKLARSPQPARRVVAARGLAEAGAGKALDALARDPETRVRGAALEALAQRANTTPEKVKILPQTACGALLDPEPAVQEAAARVVGRSRITCAEEVARLATAAFSGEEVLDLLAPLQGKAATAALLSLAQRRYATYRKDSEKWVTPDLWKKIRAASPGPQQQESAAGSNTSKSSGLEKILSRFPERAADDGMEDPLLPSTTPAAMMRRAFVALQGREEARPWLGSVALQAPPTVRIMALKTLASLAAKSPPGTKSPSTDSTVDVAIRAGLRDQRRAVERAAAEGCHLLGSGAMAVALALMETKDFDLRASSARCLGRIGGARAVKPLLGLLRKERQVAAIVALARVGDKRAAPKIAALLKEDHHADRQGERVEIINALGQLGDPGTAPDLERELTHPTWRVRRAAARALGRLGRSASRKVLEVCRFDYYEEVRRACEASLKRLRSVK